MIFGIGTDLVETERIANKLLKNTDFIEAVFSVNEIKYCNSNKYPEQHYSARFAAKEAFLKALGKGLQCNIELNKIEILNSNSGEPIFAFQKNEVESINKIVGSVNWKIHLSMSHILAYANAMVIIELVKK